MDDSKAIDFLKNIDKHKFYLLFPHCNIPNQYLFKHASYGVDVYKFCKNNKNSGDCIMFKVILQKYIKPKQKLNLTAAFN